MSLLSYFGQSWTFVATMQMVRTLFTLWTTPLQQVRVETGGWVQLLESVTPGLLPSQHLVYDGVGWPGGTCTDPEKMELKFNLAHFHIAKFLTIVSTFEQKLKIILLY